MEDVSKALLIGAGMFFAILIISALVMFYNQVSSFYNSKHDANVIEQTQKFNARFTNYYRKNIRGSDLISLMNMVIDYNELQSYIPGKDGEYNYERIKVTIQIGNKASDLNSFMYDENFSRNGYIANRITNMNKQGMGEWNDDGQLIKITNTRNYIISDAFKGKKDSLTLLGIDEITDTQLQQLASKISDIMDEKKIATKVIKDILGVEIGDNEEKLKRVRDIANIYYQYMQFKRAMFDCTGVEYDPNTNRIVKMSFEVQTKIEDGKTKVVFD